MQLTQTHAAPESMLGLLLLILFLNDIAGGIEGALSMFEGSIKLSPWNFWPNMGGAGRWWVPAAMCDMT